MVNYLINNLQQHLQYTNTIIWLIINIIATIVDEGIDCEIKTKLVYDLNFFQFFASTPTNMFVCTNLGSCQGFTSLCRRSWFILRVEWKTWGSDKRKASKNHICCFALFCTDNGTVCELLDNRTSVLWMRLIHTPNV